MKRRLSNPIRKLKNNQAHLENRTEQKKNKNYFILEIVTSRSKYNICILYIIAISNRNCINYIFHENYSWLIVSAYGS